MGKLTTSEYERYLANTDLYRQNIPSANIAYTPPVYTAPYTSVGYSTSTYGANKLAGTTYGTYTGQIGGNVAAAQQPYQPTTSWVDDILSWFKKPAQATQKAKSLAMDYAIKNPNAPATQQWSRTLNYSGMQPSTVNTIRNSLYEMGLRKSVAENESYVKKLKELFPTEKNGQAVWEKGTPPTYQQTLDWGKQYYPYINQPITPGAYGIGQTQPKTTWETLQNPLANLGVKPAYAGGENIDQIEQARMGQGAYRVTTSPEFGNVQTLPEIVQTITTDALTGTRDITKIMDNLNTLFSQSWVNKDTLIKSLQTPTSIKSGEKTISIAPVVAIGLSDLNNDGQLENSLNLMNNNNLVDVVSNAANMGLGFPTVPPERLDTLTQPSQIKKMWDTGYTIPRVINEVNQSIQSSGVQIEGYDPNMIKDLTFDSITSIIRDLSGQGKLSTGEIQDLLSEGGKLRIAIGKQVIDDMGNVKYEGYLDTVSAPKKTKEQTDEEYYADYWSQTSIDQRNKQREESYAWQQAKDLEGWKEYYAILAEIKLSPVMNDYFEQPTIFATLRRKWEVSGSDKTWEQWLKDFNWSEEIGKMRPSERGERTKSRIRTVSY